VRAKASSVSSKLTTLAVFKLCTSGTPDKTKLTTFPFSFPARNQTKPKLFENIMSSDFSSYEPLPYDNDPHERFSQGLDEARFLSECFGQELHQGQVEKCPPVYPTPIASHIANVVDEVPLKEDSRFKDQQVSVRESLVHPLVRSLPIDLGNIQQQQVCIVKLSQIIEEMIQQSSLRISHEMEEISKSSSGSHSTKIRQYQSEQWDERFEELVQFKNEHGHSVVPINWQPNIPLALWVKRQRQQYQRKNKDNMHSTLTDWRQEALEKLGFVWESRGIAWEERYAELVAFHELHGHCNIAHYFPKTSPLSIWAKAQRRQFKLFSDKKRSSITPNRVIRLNRLGFDWFPRRGNVASNNKML
jgi:hypothetical protein